MTTNPYVNQPGNPDVGLQSELDKLFIESIQFGGQDFYYIPRTLVKEDFLFGEDVLSKFEEYYTIEMAIINVTGYDGDKEFVSKFGFEMRDSATLEMSKTRWHEESGSELPPKEGDLIYYPVAKSLFEIKFTDYDNPFYQHDKLYAYFLTVEKYDHTQNTIDTGVEEIDEIMERLDVAEDDILDPFADNDAIEEAEDDIQDASEAGVFGEF